MGESLNLNRFYVYNLCSLLGKNIEYGLINDFYVLKLKRRIYDFQSGKRLVQG